MSNPIVSITIAPHVKYPRPSLNCNPVHQYSLEHDLQLALQGTNVEHKVAHRQISDFVESFRNQMYRSDIYSPHVTVSFFSRQDPIYTLFNGQLPSPVVECVARSLYFEHGIKLHRVEVSGLRFPTTQYSVSVERDNARIHIHLPYYTNAQKNGFLTDFTVRGQDCSTKIHRMVLASRSAFFETLFQQPDCLEIKNAEVLMKNSQGQLISPDLMRIFIEHLYEYTFTSWTFFSRKPLSSTIEILDVAHIYEFKHLADLCVYHLIELISLENIDELLQAGTLYSPILLQRCEEFLLENLNSDHHVEIAELAQKYNLRELLNSCRDFRQKQPASV